MLISLRRATVPWKIVFYYTVLNDATSGFRP
jgi:hypothetical protein